MDIILGLVALFVTIAVFRRGPRFRDAVRRHR